MFNVEECKSVHIEDFYNILYLSPTVAIYADKAILNTKDLNDLDRILEMCDLQRNMEKDIVLENDFTIIPLKRKD